MHDLFTYLQPFAVCKLSVYFNLCVLSFGVCALATCFLFLPALARDVKLLKLTNLNVMYLQVPRCVSCTTMDNFQMSANCLFIQYYASSNLSVV